MTPENQLLFDVLMMSAGMTTFSLDTTMAPKFSQGWCMAIRFVGSIMTMAFSMHMIALLIHTPP